MNQIGSILKKIIGVFALVVTGLTYFGVNASAKHIDYNKVEIDFPELPQSIDHFRD